MSKEQSKDVAPQELIVDKTYSDERYIDIMAAHHAMAIDMAKLAKDKAEHDEIRDLADDMISTQEKEVEKLSKIKEREFGESHVATEPHPHERSMFAMLSIDELAKRDPFDKAFIDANIPHHASAIEMAAAAVLQSKIEDIREMSQQIVEAQSEEVGKMIGWRKEWYS